MLKIIRLLIVLCILISSFNKELKAQTLENAIFYGREYFTLEGTTIPDSLKEHPYDRLPLSYKDKVRGPVWTLSQSSAGISVNFRSNTTSVSAKWEVLADLEMNHMAETGIKGVDLYIKTGNEWQFVNTGRPEAKVNKSLLISNLPAEMREYKMYMPLYDGVVSLQIGIDSLSIIEKAKKDDRKPIVFYGTSITQGACATRPGMAYINILSRKLDIPCINYGFSGNGRMETPLVEVISNIDALFYVIDGTGNMKPEEIHENAFPLVEMIRSKHPATPIIFIDGPLSQKSYFDMVERKKIDDKNNMLKSEFEKMIKNGVKNVYYVNSKEIEGIDHEGTVDGIHYNDLGFMRFADFLIIKFRKLKLIK